MLKKYHKKYILLTNMLFGTLIKITNTRKLMIKIEEGTYSSFLLCLASYATMKKIKMDRPATFTMTNDENETGHFIMISPGQV